jgi:hypothetical protein
VGVFAGSNLITGSNNIYIGNGGFDPESNTIRIGTDPTPTPTPARAPFIQGATPTPTPSPRTFIAHIREITTGNNDAIPVVIDSAGQLGTTSSSRRFKHDIKPMAEASEAILSLKPVSFHYKSDSKGIPQFGLIAEEVAKVNPDLVVHDAKGTIYTVRYEAVNAMLLNEFLKEHSKVEKLEATIAQQHKDFETAVTELKGQIQKVSAQLELNKSAPQTVVNNQ